MSIPENTRLILENGHLKPVYETLGLAFRTRNTGWRDDLCKIASLPDYSLHEISRHILSDSELLCRVAEASIRHPMGFDKIVLFRDARGAMIKIDVWWDEDDDWGTLHNHRFDFSSVVLTGVLHSRLYLEIESEEEHADAADIYRISVPAEVSDDQSVRRYFLETWSGAMSEGNAYDMRCEMFHMATSQLGVTTVTLVAQGAPRRRYSEATRDGRVQASVVPFSVQEIRERFERLEAL